MTCLCGHLPELHVIDMFGGAFKKPRTREQLGIPCIANGCGCLDYHEEPETGLPFSQDFEEANRGAEQARG